MGSIASGRGRATRSFAGRALLVFPLLLAGAVGAEEIGFVEDFALSKDRQRALEQLIPGTEDHYYYSALHFQNLQQFDQVDSILDAWVKRYPAETPRLRQIRMRQALLVYANQPERSLEYVRRTLNLRFDHQREVVGQKPNLPTALDAKLISRELLAQRAFAADPKTLNGFEDSALDWLAAESLDADRRRALLSRLQRPDYPGLAEMVVADLKHNYSRGFGSLPIHRQLLLEQLDACLKQHPVLLNENNFVATYLGKLHPNPDQDWRVDSELHREYLERLWQFVGRLAPVHNSLKAHVLYHRLKLDQSLGVWDRQRFMEYLKLPRPVAYANPDYLNRPEHRQYRVNLDQDYSGSTLLAPISNDESLVRGYLGHFLLDADNYDAYRPYVQDTYLKQLFAEVKIVNGLGEPEQWYSLLPPEAYQRLKERVDLDFVPTNPRYFGASEPVQLELDVKNVSKLIVKVYEINALNYYREQGQEISTDLELDGLIPNRELTETYEAPPLRRIRRRFELGLEKPGVYVVDFIGNGKSSRSVIRKGRLHYTLETTLAGHRFTVLDDAMREVQDATLWLGGKAYSADDRGRITVPFTNQPGGYPFVLQRDGVASLHRFAQQSENYELRAGFYVDRESLLRLRTARVVVRPALYLNGIPVNPAALESPRLTIRATDLDGVASTQEVAVEELTAASEFVREFQVPQRLAALSFQLSARVQVVSQNKKLDLTASESFQLNEVNRTDKIETLHLRRDAGGYTLVLLGQTGEPRLDRPVQLSLKHRDFKQPVTATLQTDAQGVVVLGNLPDIVSVTATGPEGTARTWPLEADQHSHRPVLHGRVGQTLQVPFMTLGLKAPTPATVSLLELRGGSYLADRSGALSLRDGLLEIKGLPAGDYDLLLKREQQRMLVRIADGPELDGVILGSRRRLEQRSLRPLQIVSADLGAGGLTVQLANAGPHTRVHVLATRFVPAYSPFQQLGQVRDAVPYVQTFEALAGLYASGRDLGDEIRYIIDRQYANRYPGNMLERPSLLLNPWVLRSTQTSRQDAKGGEAFDRENAGAAEGQARGGQGRGSAESPNSDFAYLDFLAQPSAVLLNLEPDEKGLVRVDADSLGGHQDLHVVAIDPQHTVYRHANGELQPRKSLDLRLAESLDPKLHFSQQKEISVLKAGESLAIRDLTSSRFEKFDTLSRVYTLLSTLQTDDKLGEFRFVLEWPQLSAEAKREKYSKYACHELNFFLFKKDPEFFSQVIRPYLINKRDKTFLDLWLVGAPLDEYVNPWKHGRLNVVERILLSQRLAGEQQYTSRDVRDLVSMLPVDLDRQNFLFQTALAGNALDSQDVLQRKAVDFKQNGQVELGALSKFAAPAEPAAPPAPAMDAAAAAPRPQAESAAKRSLEQALRRQRAATASKPQANALALEEMAEKKAMDGANRAADKLFDRRAMAERLKAPQYYQQLEKTEEWVENNYYHLPLEQQNEELVTASAFWSDYAAHDPAQPFFSTHVADASRNFTEIMLALAVLDLPFEAGEHQADVQDTTLKLTAASPMIVFHEEIRPAESESGLTPILVSQNLFRQGDRFRYVDNERLDKYVTDEFLVQTVYGCQVVVTNPTSSPQKLSVLLQVPAGAIPVLNGRYTHSVLVDLKPYNTQTIEYHFYFPAAGKYPLYPAQVAKNQTVLASTEPRVLNVVEQLSRIDRESWAYVSQNGTSEDVLRYLQDNNLHRTDLDKIAFRMQQPEFYRTVTGLLVQRHVYNHTLWSYAIKHNHVPGIRQFLQHSDPIVQQCGAFLDSPLLTVDPVERKAYQHRDYRPLVNARTHQLGRRRQILNDRLHAQYHELLQILSCRRELEASELMSVTYYLLLQDRIGEALELFDRVRPEQLETRVQYDYFTAYLDFYRGEAEQAGEIAARYADYPVDRWRDAFRVVDAQFREITTEQAQVVNKEDRNQVQDQLASNQPNFDFTVEDRKVRVQYQNVSELQVNYYLMDIELLFSRNPFVQQFAGQFAYIRPNQGEQIQLPGKQTQHAFELPKALHNRNVLVEITAGGRTRSHAYYSNSLAAQVIEDYGQVRVTSAADGKPLPAVYIKAYARLKDGSVRFYKDGYTDLRGRFDYSSLSTNELDQVDRFSLLILSDEQGAVIREAAVPKR